MLGGVCANVTALATNSCTVIAVYVVVISYSTANVAICIADIVIGVGINRASITATLYIASGVTIIGEGMGGNFAFVLATFYVTGGVAIIIVNVGRNFANVVATDYVTNCVTYVAINVGRNLASSTANVTICITNIAIDVFLYGRNTGFLANIASSIASIAICVGNCANISAVLYATSSIASVVKFVSRFACETANVTRTIAVT